MTFDELFKEYLDVTHSLHAKRDLYDKTNRYENHIQEHIGNLKLKKIKYKHCQNIVNTVIQVKELSVKTAKNVNAVVSAVFNYALRNEYVKNNPSTYVLFPTYDNKYNIDLSPEQIQTLIDNILTFEDDNYRDIFIFALHGRRKTEILSMVWQQVDLELAVYHIPPTKNKSKKHDIHGMSDILFDILKSRYDSAYSEYNNLEDKNIPFNQQYVFVNPNTNTRFQDVKRPFIKLKELSGIGRFRFHDFRHLLASNSINIDKKPIEHVSQALGHSSIEVTQKYITKDSSISKSVVDTFLSNYIKD